MKTKHTPGPWKFVKTIQHPEEKDQAVSFIQTSKTCYDLCFMKGFFTEEEAEANARLIAAAPELLDTLESIVETLHQMRRDETVSGMLFIATQAIQKATDENL